MLPSPSTAIPLGYCAPAPKDPHHPTRLAKDLDQMVVAVRDYYDEKWKPPGLGASHEDSQIMKSLRTCLVELECDLFE